MKESEESPIKMIELKEILKLIMEETYLNPYKDDTEEVKEQKLKQKNFNIRLLAIMDEAILIAKAMTQRRTAPIAGPFPIVKAHQFSALFNSAYSMGLTTVPMIPFSKEEMADKKVTFRENEISAKDIMPIT